MKQIFTIIPGTNAPMFLAVGVAVFNLALAGLFVYLAASTRQVRFEVSPGNLKIAGDMFGRTIPTSILKVDEMRAKYARLAADPGGEGLMFVAFGKSFDAFEAQLRRMVGLEDGVADAVFRFSRPTSGGYYWGPPGPGGIF